MLKRKACGCVMGEVGCGVMLIVVFWEVGGGYGGVTAEYGGGGWW